MRTHNHIIDTKAVKKVVSMLPDFWVVRELTERDYGIDLIAEIFTPAEKDENNHDVYEESGAVFHIQIKGTGDPIKPNADNTIHYSIKKKSLIYFERFSAPFLLFRVDVSTPSKPIYFIWIQRYIIDVLDVETPSWRDDPDDTIVVRIPMHNEVSSSIKKIEKIAFSPKYLEELVEFRELFYWSFFHPYQGALKGEYNEVKKRFSNSIHLAHRMLRMKVLLQQNELFFDRSYIENFINWLGKWALTKKIEDVEPWPDLDEFNAVADIIEERSETQSYIAKHIEGVTVY